ncbi:MAG: InlB B-repeat-containing protein [Treponema sp.]|nr:InlB B-repeat-containing protein [Treponema sp.]
MIMLKKRSNSTEFSLFRRKSLFFCLAFLLLAAFSCKLFNEDDSDSSESTATEISVQYGESSEPSSDSAQSQGSSENSLAYITLSLTDENGVKISETADSSSSARIALPLVSTASEFTSFSLSGSTDGGFEWQSLWNSDDSSSATALSQLNSASIGIAQGFWSFRLTAKKGGVTYSGQIARQEIVAGQANSLSFTLSLSKLGADESGATGGVNVSVSFPASGISLVTATLYALDGSSVAGFSEETLSASGESATYAKNGIPAGTYALTFRFYTTDASSGERVLVGIWTEYAGIASGVTSTSTSPGGNSISEFDQIYPITYSWNGGSLATGTTAQASYTRYDSVMLPESAQVSKNGYTFSGWYENASLTGTAVTEIPADTAGAKSFYAKWTANPYTVRYHKNTSASDTATKTQGFTYDTAQSLQTLSALGWTRTDATFVGWAKSASATTALYADGKSGTLNLTAETGAIVDLYAVWQYTVTYSGNKGSSHPTAVTGSTESQSVTGYTTTLTLHANGFTHSGYTFSGWNANASGTGTAYTAGSAYTFTANTTLYAKWTRDTYTITFTENSGNWASSYTKPTSYTVENSAVTLPLASNITRTGYTFGGWYESTSLSGSAVTQIASGSTGNKNYYAKWTASTYTVTLNANGGSGGTASVTATYNSAMPAITAPTRTGYTFAGYYDTSAESGGTQYYDKDSASATTYTTAGAKTLYARWEKIKCTVTIKTGWAKGATTTTTVTATYSEAMPTLTTTNPPSTHGSIGAFTRIGYTLSGFFDAASGGTKYYNADGTSAKTSDLTAATTLYAQWTAKGTQLTGSTSGGSISGTRVVSSDVSYTNASGSGMTISGTVNIYIEEGCTLTATGAAGSAGSGGYAGINVPSGATLNLYGEGSVVATGGKGGDAGNGSSNASDAWMQYNGSHSAACGGSGGAGGKGAGGGGAGIGTNGGAGGAGGSSGSGISIAEISTTGSVAGNAGGNGSAGSSSSSCGSIKKESTITITATGGVGGSAGSGGALYTATSGSGKDTSGNKVYNYRVKDENTGYNRDWTAGAGGSGGGGGAGGAGANIGTGGAGGGGGGGGAGGSITGHSGGHVYAGGGAGSGGKGATNGGNGSQDNSDSVTSGIASGGSGGAAGSGGTSTTVGSL